MASNYNHVPRPPVIAVRDGKITTLLRRETLDDLLPWTSAERDSSAGTMPDGEE